MGGRQPRVALRRSARTPRRWRRSSPCASGCRCWSRSSRSSRPRARSASTSCASAARSRDAGEIAERVAAVKPEDPYTIIYTSGTTGPPKGCVLTQGNYRQVTRMCEEINVIAAGRGRLPLPAAGALLRAADPAAGRGPRRSARLLERRSAADRAGPDGDQARVPAVGAADLREDLHARHLQQRSREDRGGDEARPDRAADARGRPGGPRGAAGRVRQGRRGAVRQRPQHLRRAAGPGDVGRRADRQGDPRVLLRLRRARARGLRDDRDLDGHHHLDGRRPPAGHRRAGDPARRGQDRRRRRGPRARPAHLRRLLRQRGHDVLRRRQRGRLAAHRRPRLARRRRLPRRSPAARRTS